MLMASRIGGTGSVAPAIKRLELAAAVKKSRAGCSLRGCKQVFSTTDRCGKSSDAVPVPDLAAGGLQSHGLIACEGLDLTHVSCTRKAESCTSRRRLDAKRTGCQPWLT